MTNENTLIHRLLTEQTAILTGKGYDERTLRSFDPPGTFLKKLEKELGFAIVIGLAFPEPQKITLNTTGYFHSDRDAVRFRFDYEYRPTDVNFRLTRLQVSLEHGSVSFRIDDVDRDLPRSSEAHGQLAYKLNLLMGPEASERETRRRQTLARLLLIDQFIFLRGKGYQGDYMQNPKDPQWASEGIERRIAECIRNPFLEKVPPMFVVPILGAFDYDNRVAFRLLYRANPEKETIQLKALHARLDEETRLYFLRSPQHLPVARKVYDTLCRQELLTSARSILDGPAGATIQNHRPNIH